jgi:hypothetical protein
LGAVLGYLEARRALVPLLAAVGYTIGVDVRVAGARSGTAWVLGVVSVWLAFAAASPRLPGNGLAEDGERRVGLLAWGVGALAIALSTVGSAEPDPTQGLIGTLAVLGASVVGAFAIARIPEAQGMATSLPRATRTLLVVTVGLLAIASVVALAASLHVLRHPDDRPWVALGRDALAVAAGGALVILLGSVAETVRVRGLELGAGDRARVATGVVLAAGSVAVGLLVLGEGAADRILRLTLAVSAVLLTYTCLHGDPETLTRRGRRAVALLLFGGPLVLLGGLASEGPGRSVVPLLATGAVALVVGSAVRYLEQPLRRADGRLLDAIEAANSALVRADPDASIREALTALRTFAGTSTQSPELWSIAPPGVLTIDGAGYPHEREASLPQLLLDVAPGEPEATVRAELVDALVVRRPDLRPLARWLDERGALAAALVTREGEVDGVIVLPRGARHVPMSLEEVRAVKRLADAFAGAAASRAALGRSLAREQASTMRAEAAEGALRSRATQDRLVERRDQVVTALAAARAHGGPYAPAARVAYDAIERRVSRRAPVVVRSALGSDVVAYIARAHLAGASRARPFVVIDGTAQAYHDPARWADPVESPLALARGGLLVVEAVFSLPARVLTLLGEALSQRRAPWSEGDATETLDVAFAVSTHERAERGADDGGGHGAGDGAADAGALTAYLEDALAHTVTWPRLRERGEDLRSLVLAGLAREGMHVRGAPLGIEDAAYAALADYPFPGEDAELRSVTQRLAQVARGDVVRVADVATLGLGAAADGPRD